ncbi:MAG TPA: hypothetical protein PLO67_09620 [Saprospiraceae bacterium]|nr:hypothetical protein [Saprospiraceae bacterium]
MQSTFRLLCLCFILFHLSSCQKNFEPAPPLENEASSHEFLTERDPSPTWSTATTVLGSPKNIPYAVNTIRQAYNQVYGTNLTTLQPNYLYVRFLPQDAEDIGLLLNTELEFWDFPLHREIISLGEKYHDPTVSSPDLTWQYAVVPADFSFPSVQYEILEPLALVPEDCKVAQAAFAISQNEYEVPDEFVKDPEIKNGTVDFQLTKDGKDLGGDTPEAPGPGNTLLNPAACGCALPDNVRKPSGCVTVQDERLGVFDPVRQVQVMTSSSRIFGFIFHRSTYTNENGCWQINHKYSGKIHVWVKFISATCEIRTMSSLLDLWDYSLPRKAYIDKFYGPNFNNISIQFNWNNIIDTRQFRNWVASTINNSIYETQRYFAFNGLPHPPGNLKILVSLWGVGNTGAAPMLDKLKQYGVGIPVVAGFSLQQLMTGVFGVEASNPAALIGFTVGSLIEGAAVPDIVFNFNDPTDVNADDVRETSYHELSHTIHFDKTGPLYWLDEIGFTAAHFGYGDGTDPGSGRVEIVESWGFMMGRRMAHIRYGDSHSNDGQDNTWQRRVERGVLQDGFIPFGWQYDLIDDNNQNPVNLVEPFGINSMPIQDAISGYTLLEIYATMNNNMLSIEQQKAALQPLLVPKGLSLSAYNALSAGYGF